MSKTLPPTSPPALDDDNEAENALLFARCSQAAADAAAMAPPSGTQKDNPLAPSTTPSNLRRSHLTYRHLVISLSTSILIGLILLMVGRSFYFNHIEPRLSGAAAPAAVPGTSASAEAALKEELAKSAEQITALQKQVDVMRREQLLIQQNTRESLESISTTLKNPQLVPPPVSPVVGQPGIPRMADVKPEISPTQQEFIILKERNRLTQYADEAIATGNRRPLEVLVEYMRDPQLPHLHDAAQAEFMRAVRAVQILQREEPGYHLPVAELFKDSSIRDDADVPPEALLKLLADYQQPWEVRVRVCFLLLGSTLPETNAQLIKSIKEDPSLDVAKHAQLALEQRIKKRFRIFDIPAIEEWFKSQEK
ncbi:MAG: hypothetical protein B7Z37_13175 [Verrucomicrobia bacterium 12-59-8]|nr:MAG: hypothetical protein B7Z37_13175 [Verrucomicrobia bacterium 12-59-8]